MVTPDIAGNLRDVVEHFEEIEIGFSDGLLLG
jgi:hypothetical protein